MDSTNRPFSFGEWLKVRRQALDLTQSELAHRAGCSVSALRKIESGERRPSKQLAGLLARALEIPDQDRQTFLRVARGEGSLKRLGKPAMESTSPLPDMPSLLQAPPSASTDGGSQPVSIFHRIPLQATPLIGREAELAAMEKLFSDPQCRLLTLTGMGGIGKTRLAIEFALSIQVDFPGGIYYFPLTGVNSPDKIVPAIADVLDFGFSGSGDPKEQLLNYIASQFGQEVFFVFDNLEHLLIQDPTRDAKSGVAELISEILKCLPHVKILGTSRERLNIRGEWTYELHGLSVPPREFVERVEDYDSIVLFVKSAQRTRTDFQVRADEEQSLVEISQLVEGIPLAIELAAAWVGILSCQEIAREIKANLDFLTTSMRDIPERHRSIRATFDHSWKLLSDEERKVFCQLSVFHAGFDRDAARQIAGASLPLLSSLSAKSLVRRTESGRYDLHEVIRQYAASHLDRHPSNTETHARHSQYYLEMLETQGPLLKSASQQDTMRQLTDEVDNIYAAWAWGIDNKKFAQLGRVARAFGWYFEIAGMYREGIDQLEMLVQALKDSSQASQWDRVLGLVSLHQALLNFRKGEFGIAQKLYEESILILRPTGDQVLLSDALVFLGTILHLQGEYKGARSLLEEGLMLARQNNETWLEAWAIYNLGHIDGLIGQYEQGYEQMVVGIAMWRELGDPQSIALGLNFLVPTLNNLGRFEEAKAYMYESITLCEQSRNRWGMGTAYRYLGLTCIANGQLAEGQAHLLKSLEIFGEFAVGWDIARSLAYLGDAAMMAADYPEARTYYRDALQSSVEAHAIPIALDALAGLGELQAQAGKIEEALLFSYYILNHHSSEEETKSRAEKLRATLEPKLSTQQIMVMQASAESTTFASFVEGILETA